MALHRRLEQQRPQTRRDPLQVAAEGNRSHAVQQNAPVLSIENLKRGVGARWGCL